MTQSSNATAKPRHPPTDWLDGTSTEQDGVVDQSSFERRLRLEAELARQQVTEIAAARQRHDLCGMCAIAAAVLHARLVKHGLHAWFVVWHGDGPPRVRIPVASIEPRNQGATKEVISGSFWTGIQGQGGSEVAAA